MRDPETTVEDLKALVLAFSKERDWEQFHSPKNLGLALASEVGELLDLFRYRSDDQLVEDLARPARAREVAHELADCLWVVLRLADVCGVDLASSLSEKVRLAAEKYPVGLAFGKNLKYSELGAGEGELPEAAGPGKMAE